MPIMKDASFVDTLPRNVAVQFLERVEKSASNEAFRYPAGDGWTSVTWGEAGAEVSRVAAGLMSLGIEPEQRVGIASGTRYEWILADLAIMCAGAATTTVYPSTNAEDTAYILSDSECHVVFAEDDEQIAKLRRQQGRAPARRQGGHLRRHRRRRLGDRAGRPGQAGRRLPRGQPRRGHRARTPRSSRASWPP